MEARYNVYFAGQLLEGHELASVKARMARLFNADEATLERLFSGRNQLVKRDCDRATALKYKQAMESAGAIPVIRAAAASSQAPAGAAASAPMTAAQKIAALAAEPPPPRQTPPPAGVTAPERSGEASGGIQLTPAGTAVLLPEERQSPAQTTVRAPDLDIDPSGQRLSAPSPPPPPAPDTSHISAGPVGERLPVLPSGTTAPAPDTSAIELYPEGADLSDCAPRAPAAPAVDLSGIDLAPAGADVLEPQYRQRHDTPAPPTDHLALEDH